MKLLYLLAFAERLLPRFTSLTLVAAGEILVLSGSFFLAETLVSRLIRVWALVASVAKDRNRQLKEKKNIKQITFDFSANYEFKRNAIRKEERKKVREKRFPNSNVLIIRM